MDLTGGGAFYSQTPKSCLEDLGVNIKYPRPLWERVPKAGEGSINKEIFRPSAEVLSATLTTNAQNDMRVNAISEQSYSSEARVSSRLENEPEINKKLDSRTQWFENGEVCHSERSEELQSLANIVSKKILKQVQDDVYGCHSEAKTEELQSCIQRMVCPLTPTPSTLRFAPVYKLAKLVPRLLLLHPAGRGVNKPAFTLAEILVTLGVIGIISAMTLPMLAENYQRIVVQTRLKKFYTTFNQAILRSVEDNGPYEGWGGYILRNKVDANGNTVHQVKEAEEMFDLYLANYLNVILRRDVIYTNYTSNILYYLADGSAFMFAQQSNRDIQYYPKDVEKCLRRGTRDRVGVCEFFFIFYPSNTEKDSYWRYHVKKGLEPFKYSWDGASESLYSTPTYGCKNESGYYGYYCTAIIQQNGWHFPKDYPRKIRY